jgi:3-oxoacyl-[acyl-carrier protein] reductase
MDLGLKGRTALIMASSRGLGLACAAALAREGCHVFLNGRDQGRLDEAAAMIAAAHGVRPATVVGDIGTEDGRRAMLDACPAPDILVTNNEGPPPGKLADWDHDAFVAAFESNMLGPALMIRAVLPGMQQRRYGRIVNITSAMVKSPRPHMGLSTAARTALTALCKSIAPTVAADNVTINNMLRSSRGIRRLLRLSVQCAGWLHLWPEHSARRRILCRTDVMRRNMPGLKIQHATPLHCQLSLLPPVYRRCSNPQVCLQGLASPRAKLVSWPETRI